MHLAPHEIASAAGRMPVWVEAGAKVRRCEGAEVGGRTVRGCKHGVASSHRRTVAPSHRRTVAPVFRGNATVMRGLKTLIAAAAAVCMTGCANGTSGLTSPSPL